MPYEALPGYETAIPLDKEQRIEDARKLLAEGAKIVLGVTVSESASSSAHTTLNSEITMKQKAGRFIGNYIVGPYALFNADGEAPFAPIGLAVWELANNRA